MIRLCPSLLLACGASLLVVPRAAMAQVPRAESVGATLEYVREAGTESCPEEASLKASVQGQLGSAVFEREPATRVASVVVRRVRGRFVARLSMRAVTGEAQGSREIESASGTCDELSEALSLALALALDPGPVAYPSEAAPTTHEAPGSDVSEPAVATVVEATPVVAVAAPSPPPPTPSSMLRWEVGLGVALSSGLLTEPALAATAVIGLRWSHLALMLEATATAETSRAFGTNTLQTRTEFVRLGACGFLSADSRLDVGVCGLGTLGVLHARSPMATDRSVDVLGAIGGRVAVRMQLFRPISLELRGDLHTNLARAEFSLLEDTLWRSPLLFGEVSLVAGVRFL